MLILVARPTVTVELIRDAGVEIGLRDLSMTTVAQRLGVTRAAVYRHVPSRRVLEELVGEHLLGEADPPAAGDDPVEVFLEEFAVWLRELCIEHPGLADYVVRLFPRSVRSARLVEHVVGVVVDAGWTPTQSLFICNTVATHAFAMVRSEFESARYVATMGGDFPRFLAQVESMFAAQPLLAQAWPVFRGTDADTHFRWCMRCTVSGALLVAARAFTP